MDFKVFHDGLVSGSLLLILFSTTLMMGAIVFKPYLALEPDDRNLIVMLCAFSMVFSVTYFFFGLKTKSVFKLELKNILRFVKILGFINVIFTPHLFFMLFLFTKEIHDLLFLIVIMNIFIELILIGLVYKEIMDLFFRQESEVKFEVEKNQKLYFEKR
ncbi:MAG: hypothetical protein MUP85_06395 [Candidatus Lokiarchaeota archaeon]|jgi:hypothetical protein|nr:hypothetical protein [Candidatus Lokiarchaeota archaeon]